MEMLFVFSANVLAILLFSCCLKMGRCFSLGKENQNEFLRGSLTLIVIPIVFSVAATIINFIINLCVKPKLFLFEDKFTYKDKTHQYREIKKLEYNVGYVGKGHSEAAALVIYCKNEKIEIKVSDKTDEMQEVAQVKPTRDKGYTLKIVNSNENNSNLRMEGSVFNANITKDGNIQYNQYRGLGKSPREKNTIKLECENNIVTVKSDIPEIGNVVEKIEVEKKDILKKYINNLTDESTLKYLYYEYFNKECKEVSEIKIKLLKELEKEWNTKKNNLYKIISLLIKNKLPSK